MGDFWLSLAWGLIGVGLMVTSSLQDSDNASLAFVAMGFGAFVLSILWRISFKLGGRR